MGKLIIKYSVGAVNVSWELSFNRALISFTHISELTTFLNLISEYVRLFRELLAMFTLKSYFVFVANEEIFLNEK